MAIINGTTGDDHIEPDYNNGPWYYSDIVYLYAGNDYVDTSHGDDFIDAGSGNDTVDAGDGDDQVYGGSGADVLRGDLGNDVIHGGDGNDIIDGGLEDDMLYGDGGDDIFLHDGIAGWDSYDGGTGTDTIYVQQLNANTLWGEIKITSVNDVEQIINNDQSGKGVDVIIDGSFDLNDFFHYGIRSFKGHDGNDNIVGDAAANALFGDKGNDTINGGAGDDQIDGEDGNDYLIGNAGNDVLTGGAGADYFHFLQDAAVDTVTDFEDGVDKLVFQNVTSLQLFDFQGDAALQYNNDTFVILDGVDISAIDSSDLVFV